MLKRKNGERRKSLTESRRSRDRLSRQAREDVDVPAVR